MKKQMFILVICALILLSVFPVAAFMDVETSVFYSQAVDTLAELGVIAGYPDGSFHPDEPLTRAQFAKMVIVMTGNEESALSKTTEVFTDVLSSHWGIGYINEAAQQGLITGYPDGSFGPEEKLTYAQALTIVIRMLGYSAEEVGTNWPFDYINKAAELGLTKALSMQNNDIVTRGVAAYILDASLTAKTGNGSQLSSFTKVEDVVLYGSRENNAAIRSNEVLTTGGTFKRGAINAEEYLGKTVTLRVNDDREIKMVSVTSKEADSVVLSAAYQDEILTADGRYISIDKQKTVYYEGAPSTYAAVYASLLQGSTLDIYDDYIFVAKNALLGPVTVTGDYTQLVSHFGDLTRASVTIDGDAAELSDIRKFDVAYYNEVTGRLYVYTTRVTGFYEKALPSKDHLQSVTVSGVTYDKLTLQAKTKLDDSDGAFKINDRVTLLFGNDGSVVDVVDENGRTLYDMGVILKAYTQTSKDSETAGKEEYYAELMLGSGQTVTYKTDKSYQDTDRVQYTGAFVYISEATKETVSLVRAADNALAGSFDKSVPSYAGHDLQQNYSILECLYSEKYDEAIVQKVNLSDITQASLTSSQILHIEYANDMEDIALIYLKDVTYDGFTFGILNKVRKDENANYVYELKSPDGTTTYSGNAGWGYAQGEAVMVMIKNGRIKTIRGLNDVEVGTEIQSYTTSKIKINDTVYKLGNSAAVIYKKTGEANWNVTTLEDASDRIADGEWAVGQIVLYSDKKTEGKIRVIRVTLKG